MTSVADAFPAPAPVAVADPAPARPESVAAKAAEVGVSRWTGLAPTVRARLLQAWADLAGAWVWLCRPPTLAELVARRVPDRDAVPGRNVGLWAGWVAYNHALIAVFAVAWPALWVLAHPARVLLAAAVAAPLLLVWI